MIFKGVRDGKPYPDHGLSLRDWARIPPRQLRLDEIVTTTKVLDENLAKSREIEEQRIQAAIDKAMRKADGGGDAPEAAPGA